MDFAAEGFYDGLDGAAREERRALLEWLVGEGFGSDELRRAHERGLLVFMAGGREVAGATKYTLADVAEESGTGVATLIRLRRAQGLLVPDAGAVALTDVDLENARLLHRLGELGFGDEQIERMSSALGRALAGVAEVLRTGLLEVVLEPGLTEPELARRYAGAAHEIMPLAGPLVLQTLSQHLLNMVQSEAIDQVERASGRLPGARDHAVAFADLVGFTRLGEEIPPEDLGAIAQRLFAVAGDVVAPPVRLVKTIGDAVMLTSADAPALVQTALTLVEASDAESARGDGAFPQIRVGLAYGPTVARGGDVFGGAVNLASRVTTIARAGSVLATRELRDAARDEFAWSAAHARRVKGLPEPVPLYRARPLPPAEGL
ncbi:MAG TPA: adenylate cyclase regulatory domain-containing protein [Baekduia sp.]